MPKYLPNLAPPAQPTGPVPKYISQDADKWVTNPIGTAAEKLGWKRTAQR
jgi:hypothetical protein